LARGGFGVEVAETVLSGQAFGGVFFAETLIQLDFVVFELVPAVDTRLAITKDGTNGVFALGTLAVVRGGAGERGTVYSHHSHTRGFTLAQFRTLHIQQLQLFPTTVGLVFFVCI
jgi:hypothetical protein